MIICLQNSLIWFFPYGRIRDASHDDMHAFRIAVSNVATGKGEVHVVHCDVAAQCTFVLMHFMAAHLHAKQLALRS